MKAEEQHKTLKPKKIAVIAVITLLLIINLFSCGLIFSGQSKGFREAYLNLVSSVQNDATKEEMKLNRIEEMIKASFHVSQDEKPTVIELSNVEQLKINDPVLYRNVEDGFLVYVFNEIAIIVNPKSERIVNATPLEIN